MFTIFWVVNLLNLLIPGHCGEKRHHLTNIKKLITTNK